MLFRQTKKTVKKISLIALAAIATLPAMGQDKLARMAPVDRKMRSIDSLSIRRMKAQEEFAFNLENPSGDLYNSWKNSLCRYDVQLPAEYKIDLRQFHMPCASRKVTSSFGYRPKFGRNHYGTDIKVYIGDTIYAAFSGKIRVVAFEGKGYGNYVVIRHPNGLETYYGHMSKHLVKANQVVKAGQPIGLGGNTGRSYGSHLHFETRLLGKCINPETLFDFAKADIKGDFYVFRANGKGQLLGGTSKAATPTKTATPAAPQKEQHVASAGSRIHTVVHRDETLGTISLKVGVTVEQLCKLNGLKPGQALRKGQFIKY